MDRLCPNLCIGGGSSSYIVGRLLRLNMNILLRSSLRCIRCDIVYLLARTSRLGGTRILVDSRVGASRLANVA